MLKKFLTVAIDTPLDTVFDYRWTQTTTESPLPQVGQFVRVPFGRREITGLVLKVQDTSDVDDAKLRDVIDLEATFGRSLDGDDEMVGAELEGADVTAAPRRPATTVRRSARGAAWPR